MFPLVLIVRIIVPLVITIGTKMGGGGGTIDYSPYLGLLV